MRRLSGLLLAGAILLLPAFSQGHDGVRAQAASALTFDGDTALWSIAIKPDKTADFEQIMAKVRDSLMKSEKPDRKQQAAGWKVVKGATPLKDGSVVYTHVIYPVVKGADSTIMAILYEGNTDPGEQRNLYELYRGAFAANLGASAWEYWRYIALPILWPTLLGTSLLLFANAFGAVATAYALTGSSVNIVTILLYAQIRGDVLHNQNLGYALALGMILITGLSNAAYIWRSSAPAGAGRPPPCA